MNTIITGLQWGDEGKGKIVDYLTESADVVIRGQGGNNAGHTVIANGTKYVLHLLPSGILWDSKINVISNGVVIDPIGLVSEIERIESQGISITPEKLLISDRAHVVMPFHKELDAAREASLGDRKIGTTKRGIGPAYADKINRCGLRMADLFDRAFAEAQITHRVTEANEILKRYDLETFDAAKVIDEVYTAFARLSPHVTNTIPALHAAWKSGKKLLFEGAQGTLLDIDFGTYPFVTSSNTTAGGSCTGSGLPPTAIDAVIGVCKAYTTRVGSGPFPTELDDEVGKHLAEKGHEFGSTTGRARRCGWFDAAALKRSIQINGVSGLCVTKLDVLDGVQTLRLGVGYRSEGQYSDILPVGAESLVGCEPVYEDMPGWSGSTVGVKRYENLPLEARNYLQRIAEICEVPVDMVSTGSDRDETIVLRHPFQC